jgi:DNA-3-methyladenine glycosylase I
MKMNFPESRNSKEGNEMKNSHSIIRCGWVNDTELYRAYHDQEWGVPVHDDRKHFEMLILEGAQAGLSWETVLKKREGYRQAFKGFDPEKVASMSDAELKKQLKNPDIIRNRLKVFSARKNAHVFLEIQKEFGSFDSYVWRFVGGKPLDGKRQTLEDVPATTIESDRLSKDLKKRGMSFVGSTIIYAHMQATGLVNDHPVSCFRYSEVKRLQ